MSYLTATQSRRFSSSSSRRSSARRRRPPSRRRQSRRPPTAPPPPPSASPPRSPAPPRPAGGRGWPPPGSSSWPPCRQLLWVLLPLRPPPPRPELEMPTCGAGTPGSRLSGSLPGTPGRERCMDVKGVRSPILAATKAFLLYLPLSGGVAQTDRPFRALKFDCTYCSSVAPTALSEVVFPLTPLLLQVAKLSLLPEVGG